MKINRIKEVVRYMWKYKVTEPLVLVGHRGIGKTQTLYDLGEEEKCHVEILRLGSKNDVGDLLGMPYVTDEKETKYAAPVWYQRLLQGGILVLDEVNRAKPSLHDAVMQLLDGRKFDVYELPSNVIIVAIMNPTTEEYDVSEFDAAMVDRGIFVKVTSDGDEVLSYVLNHDYDDEIRDVLALSKDSMQIGNGFELPPKQYTPRGLRQWNNIKGACDAFPDVANELILGCVGPEGFAAYNNRKILKNIPTADQYFKDPGSVDVTKIEALHMRVFITRVLGYLKAKKVSQELQTKFTGLCSSLSEQMIMYIARVTMDNQWINKFVEATNTNLNKAALKVAGTIAKAGN
jgi:hypothetical protein